MLITYNLGKQANCVSITSRTIRNNSFLTNRPPCSLCKMGSLSVYAITASVLPQKALLSHTWTVRVYVEQQERQYMGGGNSQSYVARKKANSSVFLTFYDTFLLRLLLGFSYSRSLPVRYTYITYSTAEHKVKSSLYCKKDTVQNTKLKKYRKNLTLNDTRTKSRFYVIVVLLSDKYSGVGKYCTFMRNVVDSKDRNTTSTLSFKLK